MKMCIRRREWMPSRLDRSREGAHPTDLVILGAACMVGGLVAKEVLRGQAPSPGAVVPEQRSRRSLAPGVF